LIWVKGRSGRKDCTAGLTRKMTNIIPFDDPLFLAKFVKEENVIFHSSSHLKPDERDKGVFKNEEETSSWLLLL
jgi:hypothetical protein